MKIQNIIEKKDWTIKEAKDWIKTCKDLIKITKCEKTRNSLITIACHCNKIITKQGDN